jgi:hypothetical protein
MDPRSTRHEGSAEVITGSSCESCHSDAPDWSIPRTDHFFSGKTDRQLCAIWSEAVASMGHHQFRDHLENDSLIGLAFKGLIGGARDPGVGTPPAPPADPPPINRGPFVNLAKDWMDTGSAACDVAGTITQEENVNVQHTHEPFPGRTDRFQYNATRSVTVSFTSGAYFATIKLNGTITTTMIQEAVNAAGQPCRVEIETVNTFSGLTTGPATVRIKDTVLFASTEPARGQTDYRIDVTLPPERTQRIDTNTLLDTCGSVLQPVPPETIVSDWSPHRFTIEGHLEDRRQRPRVGGCDKIVKSSDVARDLGLAEAPCFRFANVGNKHEPWLMHHEGSGAFADGKDIPHQVTTTWNIVYRP